MTFQFSSTSLQIYSGYMYILFQPTGLPKWVLCCSRLYRSQIYGILGVNIFRGLCGLHQTRSFYWRSLLSHFGFRFSWVRDLWVGFDLVDGVRSLELSKGNPIHSSWILACNGTERCVVSRGTFGSLQILGVWGNLFITAHWTASLGNDLVWSLWALRADTVVKEIELKTANKGGLARALLARAERADHGCSRSGASDM